MPGYITHTDSGAAVPPPEGVDAGNTKVPPRSAGDLRDAFNLITQQELAFMLNVTEPTLRVWRHEGRGPDYVKFGKQVFYTRDAVERWLQSSTVQLAPRFVPRSMKQMHENRAERRKQKMDMDEFNKANEKSSQAPRYANQLSDRLIRGATVEDQERVQRVGAGILRCISAEITKEWPDTDEARMEPHMVAPAILGQAILQMCLMPENRATAEQPLALGSSVSVQVIVEMLIRSGLILFNVPANEDGVMEVDIETVPGGQNDDVIGERGPEQHADNGNTTDAAAEGVAVDEAGVRKTTVQ